VFTNLDRFKEVTPGPIAHQVHGEICFVEQANVMTLLQPAEDHLHDGKGHFREGWEGLVVVDALEQVDLGDTSQSIVIENIGKLTELGVEFINPVMEEGAAKIAGKEEIVLRVERALGGKTLSGKRIIITGGATAEPIDPVRILTNRASGKTGIELALEAFRRGAEVTLVHRGCMGIQGICEFNAESAREMIETVLEELGKGYDLLISAAAISDFTVVPQKDKIKSGKEITLTLKPAKKLIHEARHKYPDLKIIGFKAETGVTEDELIERARGSMEASSLSMVVANNVSKGGMGTEDNEVYLIDNDEVKHFCGTKREISVEIMNKVEKIL